MGRKIPAFLLVMACIITIASAQNPSKVTIKGVIKDTSNNVAGFATVMLLNPTDSTLVNFTQSNELGAFSFNNVKNNPYLLKVSHISFLPLQQYIAVSETEINDLGMVKIKPIAQELFEVVIREAKAPLRIRGDTIEYDATTFKVPPGSTVEDLLRRLPGIEVDGDGNIKAQGKDVKRLYVDGKTFFGDDPKSATKNLDANAVSKVQVFDQKSEQSQLTGVEDGSKEKAMNLQLKEEYKKGSFGKVTAAGGTKGRWAGRGNFNRFNEKQQLSFIGYGNNINETGVNWEDYSEFKGQNTFDNYDNGDFGFTSGMGRYYSFNSEDSPINNYDGRGFTKNFGGGTNYNFDNKKTKFNASYFYNYSKLNFDEYDYKETFISDSSFFNNDTTDHTDVKSYHSVGTRLEQDIDSNNKLIVKANFRYGNTRSSELLNNVYTAMGDAPLNSLFMDNSDNSTTWKVTSAAIYRLRFKKEGRSFAISAGYNRSHGDEDAELYSENHFFIPTYIDLVRQLNAKYNNKEQIKSSVLYTEPLSKNFFIEIFYNFNTTSNKVTQLASDPNLDNARIDSLSRFYTNKVMINRLGTDVRYSNNGLNIMMGVAGQYLDMKGNYAIAEDMPLLTDPLSKYYYSLSPKFSLSNEFANNMSLEFDYGYGIKEPSFDYLQPVTNVTNPNYILQGNPDLVPERTHDANLDFYYFNPASFSSVGFGSNYSYCANKIAYNQSVAWIDSVGYVTTSKPGNNSDGNDLNAYIWSSFPIIKTKFTMDVNAGVQFSNAGAYVNEDLNRTNNTGYWLNTRFDITPGKKLMIGISGTASLSDVTYSINTDQNQFIQYYRAGASVKWQFAKKFFFESNFDYTYYINNDKGFEKSLPILNASVRSLIGKKNHFEVRLAAFDIFDKRQYIEQYGNQNYVQRSMAGTLSRYFMLSFSYNIKGYENKLKKDNRW
jgi:hypothetical protein